MWGMNALYRLYESPFNLYGLVFESFVLLAVVVMHKISSFHSANSELGAYSALPFSSDYFL